MDANADRDLDANANRDLDANAYLDIRANVYPDLYRDPNRGDSATMTPLQFILLLALALIGLALLVSTTVLLYGWRLHKRNAAEHMSLLKRLDETAEHKIVPRPKYYKDWSQM